jgi:hypothetical protein
MCLEEKSKVGNPEKYAFHAYVFGFRRIRVDIMRRLEESNGHKSKDKIELAWNI